MVVMLAACLFCARDLWARGTLRAWVLVTLMNLAMIAIHTPASAAHHHGGGGVIAAESAHHSTVMTLATAFAAVEVVVAAAVLYYQTRGIRPTSMSVDGRRLENDTSEVIAQGLVGRNVDLHCRHHDGRTANRVT